MHIVCLSFETLLFWWGLAFWGIFKFYGNLNLPVTLRHAAVAAVIKLMCEQHIKGLVCPKMNFLSSFPHPHVIPDPYDFLPWKTALHAKCTFDSAFLLDSHLSSPPKSESSKCPLVLLILKTASSTSHAVSSEQFLSSVCVCLVH